MDKMSFLEAMAKSFMNHMPNFQADRLKNFTEEQQKEFIGECFDLMKDFIKAKFIDFAMEELKKG